MEEFLVAIALVAAVAFVTLPLVAVILLTKVREDHASGLAELAANSADCGKSSRAGNGPPRSSRAGRDACRTSAPAAGNRHETGG